MNKDHFLFENSFKEGLCNRIKVSKFSLSQFVIFHISFSCCVFSFKTTLFSHETSAPRWFQQLLLNTSFWFHMKHGNLLFWDENTNEGQVYILALYVILITWIFFLIFKIFSILSLYQHEISCFYIWNNYVFIWKMAFKKRLSCWGVWKKEVFFLHVADFGGFSLLLMCFCEYVYVS